MFGVASRCGRPGLGSYFKWRANEIAMRHARSLPVSLFQPLVGFAIFIVTLTFAAFVTGK
ncbi:conserved hypothetical protein [Cupriavidus necator]|uniref:Uncharacterized protein n=1 Tax=Cupriavidus necator TaxID=106590 RepID=A0A1K0ILH1_CUPNE|nr:conserved hypothetical protein [Cupriavidus necator]